jgi:hypothetical protein
MKTIKEFLRDADPLQREPAWSLEQRNFRRQTILSAATGADASAEVRSRSRIAVFAAVAVVAIAAPFLGSHRRSLFVSDLEAAVRFEVRLAEDRPGPGLPEAKISGSGRSIYLHNDVVVSNSDIASATVVQGGPAQFSIGIEFNVLGAEKMRTATANHIGKPIAILLDGQVVMVPVIRESLGASAMITGSFTKTQAERIAKGIGIQ